MRRFLFLFCLFVLFSGAWAVSPYDLSIDYTDYSAKMDYSVFSDRSVYPSGVFTAYFKTVQNSPSLMDSNVWLLFDLPGVTVRSLDRWDLVEKTVYNSEFKKLNCASVKLPELDKNGLVFDCLDKDGKVVGSCDSDKPEKCFYEVETVTPETIFVMDWKPVVLSGKTLEAVPSLGESKFSDSIIKAEKQVISPFSVSFYRAVIETPFNAEGEFLFCMNADCLDPWIDTGWDYRKNITITPDSNGVDENDTLTVSFDTLSLIASGKMNGDCNDFRLVKDDTNTFKDFELLDCNSASSLIRFKPDYNFSGADNNFYVYYGYAGISPASVDLNNVYGLLRWEDWNFADTSTPDSVRWSCYKDGGADKTEVFSDALHLFANSGAGAQTNCKLQGPALPVFYVGDVINGETYISGGATDARFRYYDSGINTQLGAIRIGASEGTYAGTTLKTATNANGMRLRFKAYKMSATAALVTLYLNQAAEFSNEEVAYTYSEFDIIPVALRPAAVAGELYSDNLRIFDSPFTEPTYIIGTEEISSGTLTVDFNYSPKPPSNLDVEVGVVSSVVDFNDLTIHSGTIGYYEWRVDGTVFSGDQNTSYSFSAPGDYNVCLFAILDVNVLTDLNCQDLNVLTFPQGVGFDYNASDVPAGWAVDFNGFSDNNIVSWYWDFGDGNVDSGQAVSHTFAVQSDWNVCLMVQGSYEAQDLNRLYCERLSAYKISVMIPFDESSGASITPFDVVIQNGAEVSSLLNQSADANFSIQSFGSFQVTVQDFNDLYFERKYVVTVTPGTYTYILQPYLVLQASSVSTKLVTQNKMDYSPIPYVNVKIFKWISGSGRTLMEDVTTDAKGEAFVSGIINNSYEFEVYYGGVKISDLNITFTSSSVYLRFVPTVYTPPQVSGFVTVNFSPFSDKLLPGQSVLSQSVKVYNSLIVLVRVFVVQDNNVLLFDRNVFSGSAETFTNYMNKDTNLIGWDVNRTATVSVQVTISDGNVFDFNKNYRAYDGNSLSDFTLRALTLDVPGIFGCNIGSDGLAVNCYPLWLLSLVIALSAGGSVMVFMPLPVNGPIYGAAVACVFLGIFTLLGWFNAFLLAFAVIMLIIFVIQAR